MCKRRYVEAIKRKKNFKIFLDDIKKVYVYRKKHRPAVPAFLDEKPSEKLSETTELAFEISGTDSN